MKQLCFYIHSEVDTELVKTIPATPKNIARIEKEIGGTLIPDQEYPLQVEPDGEWKVTVIMR